MPFGDRVVPARFTQLAALLQQRPHAAAEIRGSAQYPAIAGVARFYQTRWGVLVATGITGLPVEQKPCGGRVFAYHIHSGTSCSGNESDPFADALTHYNPENCLHPEHAGDLPPLFGNSGYAFGTVLTSRFTVREIIGKTVIVHAMPDDFTTQPAGNAGQKIACGVIRAWGSR